MNRSLSLGIDTSCYTTSISVVDNDYKIIYEARKMLQVEQGSRGLRQSDGVFNHIKNLPIIFQDISKAIGYSQIKSISVSDRPRPDKDSYMPVFVVSNNIGQILSSLLDVPLYNFSHQEGHIEAGVLTSNMDMDKHPTFLCLHISGGTTEILLVKQKHYGYDIKLMGGTTDISAGQFIDRVGVAMGFGFPCGPMLESLAYRGNPEKIILRHWVKDYKMSFSGPETNIQRLISNGDYSFEDIASSVFNCIGISLSKTLEYAVKQTKVRGILLVGGVASSSYLYNIIASRLKAMDEVSLYKCQSSYSTDNAYGTACLGIKKHRNSKVV